MKKSREEQVEIASKVIWWGVTALLVVFTIYELCRRDPMGTVIGIMMVIALNPIVIDKIFRKLGEKPDYFFFVTVLYGALGWFIACVLCVRFGKDYQNALKSFMYIIYLVFLFMTKSWDKVKKYRIFGVIYMISIVLGYLSNNMIDRIIKFLNYIDITGVLIDTEIWMLLVDGVLLPVREAILTYIIFDTVIRKLTDNNKQNDGEKRMINHNKKDKNSKMNHIEIYENKIVLENITTDIELETTDFCVSIKRNERSQDSVVGERQ